jgi:hypothetical protein
MMTVAVSDRKVSITGTDMLLLLLLLCVLLWRQVFVGSALSSDDAGVAAIKAWAVDKLPEGPTLYPKVNFASARDLPPAKCCSRHCTRSNKSVIAGRAWHESLNLYFCQVITC